MVQTESAILVYTQRCVSVESCDFAISMSKGERYIPCVNISAEPEAHSRIASEDRLRAGMQRETVALAHSHPGGLLRPSEANRRLQIKSTLFWWSIYRGDIHRFCCVPHLTERRSEYGATDYYALFRGAYHLTGAGMPDFCREDDQQRNGWNPYLDNMAVTGFYRVPLPSVQADNILLCCSGALVLNYAVIHCNNGKLLHHLSGQLSKRERYSEE